MRPPIGVGDLVRAWDAFGRTPASLAPLLRVLGLGEETRADERPPERPPDRGGPVGTQDRSFDRERPPIAGRSDDVEASSGSAPPPEPGLGAGSTVTLRALPPRPPPPPTWASGEGLAAATPTRSPPPAPLFEPRRERALLAASVRTLRSDGEIDVDAVLDAVAQGRPLSTLPRRELPSLRGGLHVLLDRSAWMAPFVDDVDALRIRLLGVVGEGARVVDVRSPRGRPDGGTLTCASPWMPRPGVPVVAVTDLGRAALRCGRFLPAQFWAATAARVAATGRPLVAIVPGVAASFTDVTPPGATLIAWDRTTRVGRGPRGRRSRS